jgi:hypothetical protein
LIRIKDIRRTADTRIDHWKGRKSHDQAIEDSRRHFPQGFVSHRRRGGLPRLLLMRHHNARPHCDDTAGRRPLGKSYESKSHNHPHANIEISFG